MKSPNDNMSGYKMTKAGWIPNEWKCMSLEKLALNGISNGVFNDPQRVGSGFRLVNVINLYKEPCIDIDSLQRLDISKAELERNRVKYGDIFFTRSSLKPEGIAYCNIILSDATDVTFDGHVMKLSPIWAQKVVTRHASVTRPFSFLPRTSANVALL